MKVTGSFFLAGLVAVFAKQVKINYEADKSVVCIKKKETLDLTIVQGMDGNDGLDRIKGDAGERGFPGVNGMEGYPGTSGYKGEQGLPGVKGSKGRIGPRGVPGVPGVDGYQGIKGDPGIPGLPGVKGRRGIRGTRGERNNAGDDGLDGYPRIEQVKDLLIHALNDYQVAENGYYESLYHVTSRDLTDGRTDTGGWGSETAKTGNYIQASYVRPVYVTSVVVAGGFIPSWNHEIKREYGKLKLEHSTDGQKWKTITTFVTPSEKKMITITFQPITAQYWRLISAENDWVGTTEFALKPLIKA